jgi:hypothetical protein
VPSPSLLDAVRQLTAMTLPDGQTLRVALYHGNEFALGPLLPYFQAGALWQSDYTPSTAGPANTFRTLVANKLQTQLQCAYWASYVYAYQTKCEAGKRTTLSQVWNGNHTNGMTPMCLSTAKLFANQRAILPTPDEPASAGVYTASALFAPIWPFVGNLPDKAPPANRSRVHAADDALWVGACEHTPRTRR